MIIGGGSGTGLPTAVQGALKLLAGVFMIIVGINMLGIFPALRKFQPRMPSAFACLARTKAGRSPVPFVVGLLNGLMPCGPLQSMQILALASGNPIGGALSMLVFSLGTAPLMLGLGGVVSTLGKKFTHKVMTAGAVLVVVLGMAMLSQGGGLLNLRLSAFGLPSTINNNINNTANNNAASGNAPTIVDGVQQVNSTLSPYGYPEITVQANIPVKWTINAPQRALNGCNYAMNIYEYNIMNFALSPGDNVIEFTPTKAGRFTYTCWMGMIRGSITVTQ
jgi:sulfite exporter TauE/SafE